VARDVDGFNALVELCTDAMAPQQTESLQEECDSGDYADHAKGQLDAGIGRTIDQGRNDQW
jgi:hypothetical protein